MSPTQHTRNEIDHALTSVDRAIADLRRGAAVVVRGGHHLILMLASEGVGPESLEQFRLAGEGDVSVAITGKRARALGLADAGHDFYLIRGSRSLQADGVEYLSDPTSVSQPADMTQLKVSQGASIEGAGLLLTKLARLLPAALTMPIDHEPAGALVVDVKDIESYKTFGAQQLRIVSQARVPLEGAEQARMVAFRPGDGGSEHFAILIGEPDLTQPVLVRLHSECFTGDLLGSLRCDCGSQLRGAIEAMSEAGSGILLYLGQEGRGIGLVNKLRAYQLQDAGYDTIDANLQLGYDEDERVYLPAAQMLKLLGVKQVKLMTNNPIKVSALAHHGIEVTERVRHVFAMNEHNVGYLQTKAVKAGHLI